MGVTALRSLSAQFPSSEPQRRTEPFRSAEEAWFWTMAALMARREGARYTANRGRLARPCEPDDVVKCLDALYRRRRIDLVMRESCGSGASDRPRRTRPMPASAATGGCGARRWIGWNGRSG